MIRFPLATSSWDEAEQAALQRVIASDRYSMGAEVAAFEADFARFTGSRHAVMVNSGSSANLAMVAALRYTQNPDLRLMPGDEVIVPAVSWSTTFFPLHQYGLHLKFVDIDAHTLNYDLTALESAIAELEGVTLESIVIATRTARCVRRLAERGVVKLKDFPLLMHVDDIITNGASVAIPWAAFETEKY